LSLTAPKRPPGHARRRGRAARHVADTTGKALVIVESPNKSRTLVKFLGRGFTVMASNGHIMDLPKSKLGVDIEHDFEPDYQVIHGKSKIITELRQAAKDKENIYLAPDPDREGEAVAWHLAARSSRRGVAAA
jgi:DNA topoisomerase-1